MVEDSGGARRWFFPDGYLPEPDNSPVASSHEAVCVINPTESEARLKFTVFFEDQAPIEDVEVKVGPRRNLHIRLDRFEEYTGVEIPTETPYGLKINSNVKVICQLSRMDTRGDNLSLFTTTGYWENCTKGQRAIEGK